jgi:hypothetical protein
MKYPSILVALATLAPISLAEKPLHQCLGGGNAFELGGYNVKTTPYNKGIEMVNELWRKELIVNATVTHKVDIWPSTDFNFSHPNVSRKADDYFTYENQNGIYRGVGVWGGDTEVSNDEALYVDFNGLKVTELSFGVRALFTEGNMNVSSPFNETGAVYLYNNDVLLNVSVIFDSGNNQFHTDGNDTDDGQEYFYFTSPQEFDAISFISKSHKIYNNTNIYHDFFLEYMDLCEREPEKSSSVTGDPHIEMWSGMKFDFHGVCDLVLLQNPDFDKKLGMDIHVRTEQLKQFSYVSSAVLRIGDDTLEVMGGNEDNLYWINQQANKNLDDGIVGFLSGYPVFYKKVNSKQYEFTVKIGGKKSIVITTFKKFVRVSIRGATEESFGTSRGLLGSYGSGKMLARDSSMVLEDPNAFGQEWQVLPSEDMIFHDLSGPQAPEKCNIPLASTLRRRLGESEISEEEAEFACARVSLEDFDMCVFDVMATGDKDVVGAY